MGLGLAAAGAEGPATGGRARLLQLRTERDGLLREANRAAAAGDTRAGDANFAKVREVNAMITALRGELIQADLAIRQAALSTRLGDLTHYQTWFHDPFLLIVPAHDAEFAKLYRYLPQAEQAIYARLGCRNRPETVTVIIAGGDRAGLREMWRQLTGGEQSPSPENPLPWPDGIFADMNHGPGPLLAGIARAFVRADFPEAPDWLVVMLATLNETSRIVIDPDDGRSHLEYLFNWRFAILAENGDRPPAPTLREILRPAEPSPAVAADIVAVARLRHWGLWLDTRGWLRPWYEAYRDYRPLDPTGIKQLDQVSRLSLEQLLAEHEQWLGRQRAAWRKQSPKP